MVLDAFRKAERPVLEDEISRLDRLLARQEKAVQEAFAAFLQDARSADTIRRISDLLEIGDIEGALGILDSYIARMAAVLPTAFQTAGAAEAASLGPLFASIAPTVAIAFDPSYPRAAELAQAAKLEFIREFTEGQRASTREALTLSFSSGQSTQGTARAFRDSIGLTNFQRRSVESYRRLLEAGSREALDRQLRDRRFDRSVERASRTGEPLSADQIDRMVDRYRARFLIHRSEMIARTEAVRITSVAREEAFLQALATAGLTEADAEQTWRTTRDGRERATHRAMNGQTHPLGVPFTSPSGAVIRYPGDPLAPADEVIQCRCHRTFRIRPAVVGRLP